MAISFEEGTEPAAALVGQWRAEGGGSETDEMLEAIAPARVGGEPSSYHEHSGRMHDCIERLVGVESGSHLERAVESFRDVLDRDFVGERPVAAGVDHRDVVAALLEDALPHPRAAVSYTHLTLPPILRVEV